MKTQTPIEAPANKERKPWKTIKGQCREVPIYRWTSGGRTFYRVPIAGGTPDSKTTSNKQTAIDRAKTLADVPANLGPTLAGVAPELLVKTGEALLKLEPVLTPLGMSIGAGLEEYANIKARTGKLFLPDILDGLLASAGPAVEATRLEQLLREVSAAIAKLTPILDPLKVSIASGIEEYAAVKTKAGAQDLRELFGQLTTRPWVQLSRTPIAEVIEKFLLEKKQDSGVQPEYYRTLYYPLAKVVDMLGNLPLSEITTDHLKQVVFRGGIEPRSRKTYSTNVRTFFKWCRLNGYLDYGQPSAAERLPKVFVAPPTPRILKVEEARALLTALEDPWCLLFLVMSLFTGVRHDELQDVTFEMIRPGRVLDIPADISKTKERRVIPIQAALNAWLAPFYGRSGLVLPIREMQAKVLTFLKRNEAPGVPRAWNRNWLRKSFCSYRLAQTGNVMETSKEDGHSAYILETVYREIATPEAANEFFALSPAECGKPNWAEQVKLFLAGQPEIHKRVKKNRKSWRKIVALPVSTMPDTKERGSAATAALPVSAPVVQPGAQPGQQAAA